MNPGRWNGQHAIFSADGTRTISFDIGGKVAEINDIVSGQQIAALEGHSDTITAIALSPDGQMILTASSDNTIRLWDSDTGAVLATLRGHGRQVNGATFSPDSRQVVSASVDQTVRIWHVKSGAQRLSLAGDALSGPYPRAAYGPQGKHVLALTQAASGCAIWDTATGKRLVNVPGSCIEPPVQADVLVSGWGDTACVWDRASGKQLAVLSRNGGRFRHAQQSEDGEAVLIISEHGPNYVWHWKSGRRITLGGQQGQVTASCLSPDSKVAVTGSSDGRVSIWDVENGDLESEHLHSGAVRQTRFNSDGRLLLTITDRNTAHLWDVVTKREIASMSAPGARMDDGQFNAGGTRVVTFHSHRNDAVRVWDARSGALLSTLADMPGRTKAVFATGGNQIAIASMTKGLILWDFADEQSRVISDGLFRSVAFSPNGKWLAATTSVPRETPITTPQHQQNVKKQPPTLFVWETARWELQKTIPLGAHDTYFLRFLADGAQVFVGVQSYGAKIFDQRLGQEKARIVGHAAPVTYAAFSPDGKQVLTASWDRTANLSDVITGENIRTFEGHTGAILHAALGPHHIATASADGTCIVWNRQTGKPAATLTGHTDQVGFIAFSPNFKRLLTLSRDRSMRLWSLTGRELDQKLLSDRLFVGAQFQPDGKGLLVVPGLEARDRQSADQREEQPGFNIRIYPDLGSDRFGDKFVALPHARPPIMGRFGPHGKRVITVDATGAAYIWNAETGGKLRTIYRDDQQIEMAMFDPTGDRILISNGSYLSLRDSKTGAELMTLRETHGPLMRPMSVWPVPQLYQPFSPDGRWLVSVGFRGHVRQWPVNPLDIAEDYTARELTPAEIEHFEIRKQE